MLILSPFARMRCSSLRAIAAVLPVVAALAAGGCARSPGNSSNIGPSLLITVQYAGTPNIQSGYSYFVLIRDADDQQGKQGPAPVIGPPYGGNGFATAYPQPETTAGAGFTDFAVYNVSLGGIFGCQLYHVTGGVHGLTSQPGTFRAEGPPVNFVPPSSSNPNQIQFQIALSQILPQAGECDPNTPGSCPQAHFLQVNIIATSDLPANSPNIDPNFYTDAIGDQHSGSATFNTYVTVDTTSANFYQSTGQLAEPDNDTYPQHNDPAYEMTGWTIQVLR